MILLSKQVLFLGLCLLTVPVFSQNTTITPRKATSTGNSFSANQSKMLCKAWKLDTVSQFGVASKPEAKEANDEITFIAGGSVLLTQEGVANSGTWSCAAGRVNITTKEPVNNLSFKLISLTDAWMTLEYQTPDLIRTQYIYSPKK